MSVWTRSITKLFRIIFSLETFQDWFHPPPYSKFVRIHAYLRECLYICLYIILAQSHNADMHQNKAPKKLRIGTLKLFSLCADVETIILASLILYIYLQWNIIESLQINASSYSDSETLEEQSYIPSPAIISSAQNGPGIEAPCIVPLVTKLFIKPSAVIPTWTGFCKNQTCPPF